MGPLSSQMKKKRQNKEAPTLLLQKPALGLRNRRAHDRCTQTVQKQTYTANFRRLLQGCASSFPLNEMGESIYRFKLWDLKAKHCKEYLPFLYLVTNDVKFLVNARYSAQGALG